MDFKELTDYCQSLAILTKLEPNAESVWRSICRSYSIKFSTPLHLCLEGQVDPETILLNLYEEELEAKDAEEIIESLLDLIYRIEDPEYEKAKEDDLQDFIAASKLQEVERVKKLSSLKKPLTPSQVPQDHSPSDIQAHTSKVNEKLQELNLQAPTGGKVDFSFLGEDGETSF